MKWGIVSKRYRKKSGNKMQKMIIYEIISFQNNCQGFFSESTSKSEKHRKMIRSIKIWCFSNLY